MRTNATIRLCSLAVQIFVNVYHFANAICAGGATGRKLLLALVCVGNRSIRPNKIIKSSALQKVHMQHCFAGGARLVIK
jgi:hypothetical protein